MDDNSQTEFHKSPSMDIIQCNSSHSHPFDLNAHPTSVKPARRPSSSACDGPIRHRKQVSIPPSCLPAFYSLKHELGLRSDAATLHWLLHHCRPHLVSAPSPPYPPPARPEARHLTNPASASPPPHRPPVRATVAQASTVLFDTPATLDKAERLIARAAAYGSQVVVFPEAFIGGYPSRSMKFNGDDHHKYRASAVDVPGPEIDRLAEIAGKYKVHLVMGVVERTPPSLFSTMVFFDSNGIRLGKHRKQMLMPAETAVWHSGRKYRLPTYRTSVGNIGGLICWDNKSPLLRSELYIEGVEMYCAPSTDARDVWKASVIHIAAEGCCFVLSANQFWDSADEITGCGGSLIVSPLGQVLAGPNYQGECLISADLDMREIEQAKMELGVTANSTEGNHGLVVAREDDESLCCVDVKEVPQLLSSE